MISVDDWLVMLDEVEVDIDVELTDDEIEHQVIMFVDEMLQLIEAEVEVLYELFAVLEIDVNELLLLGIQQTEVIE